MASPQVGSPQTLQGTIECQLNQLGKDAASSNELYEHETWGFISIYASPERATPWAAKIQDENKCKEAFSAIHTSLSARGQKVVLRWMDGLDPSIRKEMDMLADSGVE